jgi:D-aminopeptidase
LATDAPLSSRQLTRIAKRSGAALGRTGSFLGHGSGDIALAFSTADRNDKKLNEPMLDHFFLAGVEATEEAIYSAMWHGTSRKGYDGKILPSLRDLLAEH